MNTSLRFLACGLLWLAAVTGSAVAGAVSPAAFSLAQSAQITVRATQDEEWLTLNILRTGTQTPIVTRDVTVSVAGKAIQIKPRSDGTIVLPVKQLGTTRTPTLDIIVGHDGIHEIVSGKLQLQGDAPAAAPGAGGHNQMVWWVVNIAIIFVVALYFSNRKKKPEESAPE